MKFESPKKKELRTQRELCCSSTYGTPLWLRKPETSTLSVSPILKKEILTFLSPKRNGRRKSIAAAPRINGCFIQTSNSQLSDNENLEECYYRTVNIPPSHKSCKRGRLLNSSTDSESSWGWDEDGTEMRPCSPCDGINKRRRIGIFYTSDIDRLHDTYKFIDHWQEQMNSLLARNWNYKRKHWIEQCQNILWNVLEDPTVIEKHSSEIIPKTLHTVTLLSEADKHWFNVLVNSTRVYEIKSPEFSELTYNPQNNKGVDEEFEFQIQFKFGYDLEELIWFIHHGVGKILNDDMCNIIAVFVGSSKFICDVQIYFKKLMKPWWEQDGIAKMQHFFNGKSIDMIDFSPEEEVYFVHKWPANNILVDDYNQYMDNPDLLHADPSSDPHTLMEKKFISAICCQIAHLCICKTPAPMSCAARNILKQISMVLNGWFIGVLLGEGLGITPEKVQFEYDTRASSLAPPLARTL